MIRKNKFTIFGIILFSASILGIAEIHERNRRRQTIPLPAKMPNFRESRQSVGWVFGRMIGVPGADRPLLPPPRIPVSHTDSR